MNNNRFFLAVLTGSIIAFFGGWLLFGILFSNYYTSNISEVSKIMVRQEPKVWAIAIGNIAWTLLLVYVMQKNGSNNFVKGFVTSLWVSFLVTAMFDFSNYAFWNIYEMKFVIIDVVITSVFWAVVGGISGVVLGTERHIVKPA